MSKDRQGSATRLRKVIGIVLDMPMTMLPCLLFVGMVNYTAWCWWWI